MRRATLTAALAGCTAGDPDAALWAFAPHPDAGQGGEAESEAEAEGACDPWDGTLASPDDFTEDETIGSALKASGIETHAGADPRALGNEYCVEGQIVGKGADAVPRPVPWRLAVSGLGDGRFEVREFMTEGESASAGTLVGSDDRFTLWLDARFVPDAQGLDAGLCDRRDALVQTDASINHGNSGGPLLDRGGQVVAIASFKVVGTGVEGLGFGVPVSAAARRLTVTWK